MSLPSDWTESSYQVSLGESGATAAVGSRNCFALGVQEVLDYLGVTSSMTSSDTTLTYDNLIEMFWPGQNVPVSEFAWLRSADAGNSGSAWSVYGYIGNLSYNGYNATYLVRPAFVIDLSQVTWQAVS